MTAKDTKANDAKAERLAAALRDNLRRRKAQAREPDDKTAPDEPTDRCLPD
jgi:hypothetical protein